MGVPHPSPPVPKVIAWITFPPAVMIGGIVNIRTFQRVMFAGFTPIVLSVLTIGPDKVWHG
jgi:hypothetical protein